MRYVPSLQAAYKRLVRFYSMLHVPLIIFVTLLAAFSFGISVAEAARNASVIADGGPDSGPEPITSPPWMVTPIPTPDFQPTLVPTSEESAHEPYDSSAPDQNGDQPKGLDQRQPPAATTTPEPTATPTPERVPADVLRGNLHWTKDNSPVVITTDQLLPAGSSLKIDPGVEVRFGPDIRLQIEGTLNAKGSADEPVRLVGMEAPWNSLVGTESSTIILEHVQLYQAGSSGTALSSAGGTLIIRDTTLSDSSGGISAISSTLTISNTEIMENRLDGAAVSVQLPIQGTTSIIGNRIGNNSVPPDTPQVFLSGGSITNTIEMENNLFIGRDGPGVVLNSDTPLKGTIGCNTFKNGTIGLQLRTNLPDTTGFALAITDNTFIGQTDYGATGALPFDLANNWWGDPLGPFAALRNPQGRGVPIGVNIQFQPWLTDRPACTLNE